MKRIYFILLFSMLFVLSACGKANIDQEKNYGGQNPSETEESTTPVEPGDNTIDLSNQPNLQNRKIIYTVDLSIVSTSPTDAYNDLMNDLNSYEAYVEAEEITSNKFKITIRVKSENLSDLVNAIQGSGETITYKKTSQDITNSYSTLSARLNALQTQHARILELIENASNLNEIIILEEKRAEIESELNEIGLKLNNYDSLVEYSTVHLTISKIDNLNELLPKTVKPSVNIENRDKRSISIMINNPGDYTTTMTIVVTQNGNTVRELTKEVYRNGSELIEIDKLKPGKEYRIEITSQIENHSQSDTRMIEVKTLSTFGSKVSSVFTTSLRALVKFFEFISLAIIAILPFAVVFTIIIGIPLKIYFNIKKKRNVKKHVIQPKDNK